MLVGQPGNSGKRKGAGKKEKGWKKEKRKKKEDHGGQSRPLGHPPATSTHACHTPRLVFWLSKNRISTPQKENMHTQGVPWGHPTTPRCMKGHIGRFWLFSSQFGHPRTHLPRLIMSEKSAQNGSFWTPTCTIRALPRKIVCMKMH